MKKTSSLIGLLCSCLILTAQHDSLVWDGATRFYFVHEPSSFTSNENKSLIVALHGGFGSGSQLEKQSLLSEKADHAGFLVAYPDGIKSPLGIRTWNADGCCGYAQKNKVDDVGFLNSLIDSLVIKYKIDPHRVYITGMSNGAFMAYRLACELSSKIAAIAPVAGTMNVSNCSAGQGVPVIHFNSYLDGSIPWQGGIGNGVSSHYNPPLDSVLDIWKSKNSCSPVDTLVNDNNYTHLEWNNCSCGHSQSLYITHDGGHSWPGGKNTIGGDPVSTVINANDLMWDFFKNNTSCINNVPEQISDEWILYPNPANNLLTLNNRIEARSSILTGKIFNQQGQLLKSFFVPEYQNTIKIDISDFPGGSYYLSLITSARTLSFRFIK